MSKLSLHVAAVMLWASAAGAAEPAAPAAQNHGQDTCATESAKNEARRTVVSLDGTWQIAEGKMGQVPVNFDRSVPVPGLVSLATPAFDAPGPKAARRLPRRIPSAMPSGIGGRSHSKGHCPPLRL